MKKKVLKRGLFGFPMGIAMGYVITIIISLAQGDGYYSVVPSLVDTVGSEIGAVVVQTILSGVLGAVSAAISVIWEMENWSIAKQTGLYFLGLSVAMCPIAYFAHWMPHSLIGFTIYFASFVAIFIIIWVIQYFIWRSKINAINKNIKAR